jgi:hypothetical protein
VYVDGLVGNIKKSIALKNITFSNSPAETKNRTFKSYYTDIDIDNTSQLYNRIDFYVKDVDNERPSAVLKGFTPTEVYTNTRPDFDFASLRIMDIVNRKEVNKNSTCNACELIKL